MPLFDFLAELMQRYGISLQLDTWYFAVVQAIQFLPRDQVESIYRTYGHAVLEPICGLTQVRFWPDEIRRDVPNVWIAEPDSVCRVQDLRLYIAHELEHVRQWIVNAAQTWPGHD